jgi:hypothetical protein
VSGFTLAQLAHDGFHFGQFRHSLIIGYLPKLAAPARCAGAANFGQ